MEVCGYCSAACAPPASELSGQRGSPFLLPLQGCSIQRWSPVIPLCTRSSPSAVPISCSSPFWISNVIQKQLELTQKQFRLSGCPQRRATDPSGGGFSDRVPSAGFSWFASSGSSSASHVRLITAFHFDPSVTSVACV